MGSDAYRPEEDPHDAPKLAEFYAQRAAAGWHLLSPVGSPNARCLLPHAANANVRRSTRFSSISHRCGT